MLRLRLAARGWRGGGFAGERAKTPRADQRRDPGASSPVQSSLVITPVRHASAGGPRGRRRRPQRAVVEGGRPRRRERRRRRIWGVGGTRSGGRGGRRRRRGRDARANGRDTRAITSEAGPGKGGRGIRDGHWFPTQARTHSRSQRRTPRTHTHAHTHTQARREWPRRRESTRCTGPPRGALRDGAGLVWGGGGGPPRPWRREAVGPAIAEGRRARLAAPGSLMRYCRARRAAQGFARAGKCLYLHAPPPPSWPRPEKGTRRESQTTIGKKEEKKEKKTPEHA